jgi:alkaline phosphatase D
MTRGFTHGVASGDPNQSSVILWTRCVGSGDGTPLSWEVAEDADFGRVVARGEALAAAERDWCAKAEAGGLAPGRWYYYRFTAQDGTRSLTGRTRTLPQGPTAKFSIAAFSCANFGFGWFNAYAHAAQRNDIDLVVHLGDYIYEYGRDNYPNEAEAVSGRRIDPATEILKREDYWRRYATYRADADLARLHQLWPSVSIWDDHESANDAWVNGAQNHSPETEGEWSVRKAAAKRAYYDWMPMRETPYAAIDIGDLATFIRLDTRLEGRDQQLDLAVALAGATDLKAGLETFVAGPLGDPARQMLGVTQEAWLFDQFAASVKRRQRWQLVAQQVLIGNIVVPPDATTAWLGGEGSRRWQQRLTVGVAAGRYRIGHKLDMWDGYPAARARMLGAAQNAGANLVTLAGDSHNAWAFNLSTGGKPAGVEFATPGVTSPGLESELRGISADGLAASLKAGNPQLAWVDTARRGYMTVTLTPDAARCDWTLLDGVRTRGVGAATRTMTAARGGNVLAQA